MIKELKTSSDYNVYLNKCYDMVIEDMKTGGLIDFWDGEPTKTNPEFHFKNIVEWCKNHIKNNVWSSHESAKTGFRGSYGAKHLCEKDLKCYVANNWMKLAMIWSGLEVCDSKKCINYNTGKVTPVPVSFQDILDNKINFICRRVNYYDNNIFRYNCIFPYADENLKIN